MGRLVTLCLIRIWSRTDMVSGGVTPKLIKSIYMRWASFRCESMLVEVSCASPHACVGLGDVYGRNIPPTYIYIYTFCACPAAWEFNLPYCY